jgi:hypothetical protein
MGSKGIYTRILWLAFSLHSLSQELFPHFLLEQQRNIAGPSALAQVAGNPERRQMPPEEYEKVCAQVLAHAKVQLSPKLKNPGISQSGLDPAVVSALQEQRAYLDEPHALNRTPSAPAGSAKLTNYGVGNSSLGKDLNPGLLPQPGDSRSRNPKDVASAPLCRAPMIRSVNGKSNGVVFTPLTQNNLYRIEGCFFGNVVGQLQLEPHPTVFGQSALPISLQLDNSVAAWTDNEIDAHLDPKLSGILDYPVTLVIYPGKGQRMELPGCVFIAVRGEAQLLNVIPSTWVKLHATTAGSRSIKQLEYVSPPVRGSEAPRDAGEISAFVVRVDADNFGAGRDIYDFSRLNSGWAVDSVQLRAYSASCPGSVTTVQSLGRWDVAWGPRSFTVGWEDDFCISRLPPSFTFSLSFSQYAAKVWVIGPIGTQPVTHGVLGLNP